MVHMAMKVERQLKKKGTVKYTSGSSTPWKPKWDSNGKRDGVVPKLKFEPSKWKEDSTIKPKPKIEPQPSKNRDLRLPDECGRQRGDCLSDANGGLLCGGNA